MPNYDKLTAKLAFYIFCVFGGIYKSNKISKSARRVWSAYSLIGAFLFSISPTFYYVFIHIDREIDLDDLMEGGMMAALMFLFNIGFPLITVYYYDDLDTVSQYFMDYETYKPDFQTEKFVAMTEQANREAAGISSNQRKTHKPIANVFARRRNPLIFPVGIFIFGFIGTNLTVMTPLLYILYFADHKAPNLLQYYPLPLCFYDLVSSRRVYYFIYSAQVAFAMGPLVSSVSVGIYSLTIASLMNNIVIDYIESIQRLSVVTMQFLEGSEEKGRVNQFIRCFEEDVKTLVKKYNELTLIVEKVKPFFDIYFTLVVITGGVAQFCNIYGLLSHTEHWLNLNTVRHLMALGPCTLFLWNACWSGKIFEEMSEAIRYEVYNLPWFHMPPKTRKLINIYQSMVLNNWDFKAFKVYPVDMALFPRVMNVAYSYFNIMRTAAAKYAD